MTRGGGKLTSPLTTAADERYHYGTKAEVGDRLEDGFPATESHFSQIRPADNLSPKSRNFDQKNGKGQGANGPVQRNGNFGRAIKRGEG
jgi:hypothetical protein